MTPRAITLGTILLAASGTALAFIARGRPGVSPEAGTSVLVLELRGRSVVDLANWDDSYTGSGPVPSPEPITRVEIVQGDPVCFTVTLRNTGNAAARGIRTVTRHNHPALELTNPAGDPISPTIDHFGVFCGIFQPISLDAGASRTFSSFVYETWVEPRWGAPSEPVYCFDRPGEYTLTALYHVDHSNPSAAVRSDPLTIVVRPSPDQPGSEPTAREILALMTSPVNAAADWAFEEPTPELAAYIRNHPWIADLRDLGWADRDQAADTRSP